MTKRKLNDISTPQQQYIPDISFHLIFCFLSVRELSIILQCSHDFKRLVTQKSFISMYSSSSENEILAIKDSQLSLLEASLFKPIVKNIEFQCDSSLDVLWMLTKFTSLKKMILCNETEKSCHPRWIPYKPHILNSLQELYMNFNYTFNSRSFANKLFNSFSYFPNLKKLEVEFHATNYFAGFYMSTISQLQKLKSLRMRFIQSNFRRIYEIIIDSVRLLPELEVLDIDGLFPFKNTDDGMINLRRLCAQPGPPPALKTIGLFREKIPRHYQVEFVELLKQLPSFDRIDYTLLSNADSFPIYLSLWIQKMIIFDTLFIDVDISKLGLFNRLSSIILTNCSISKVLFTQFIETHASRLEELEVDNTLLCSLDIISFRTISLCTNLVHLHISNCRHLLASEFHFLNECKNLRKIVIYRCGFIYHDLSADQKLALQLPSEVFPKLTICQYDI
jgi:hypothetical protein